ncbi:hypothetical protein GOODEAATRI_017770, partial [Goodea atripinnis]
SKSPQGLVGLRNLGNTCFMNSILQCLSNTSELRDYCLRNIHHIELNKRTNLALMEEFAKLTQCLWMSANNEAVSPSEFRNQIQRFAPKFVGCNTVLSLPAERPVYNLYAVSNHTGNTLGGHYTAYCRNPVLGEWYTYNDSRYQISHHQVTFTYHLIRWAARMCSLITQSAPAVG